MKRFKKNKNLLKHWLSRVLEHNKITYEERLAKNILRLRGVQLDDESIRKILGDIK